MNIDVSPIPLMDAEINAVITQCGGKVQSRTLFEHLRINGHMPSNWSMLDLYKYLTVHYQPCQSAGMNNADTAQQGLSFE